MTFWILAVWPLLYFLNILNNYFLGKAKQSPSGEMFGILYFVVVCDYTTLTKPCTQLFFMQFFVPQICPRVAIDLKQKKCY